MAGPEFDYTNIGVNRTVANKTISIHTNPGFFGIAELNRAHVNILVNSKLDYQQPGCKNIISQVSNYILPQFVTDIFGSIMTPMIPMIRIPENFCDHSFPKKLIGAMCAETHCYDDEIAKSHINLNIMYNDKIPDGTYHLTLTKCYPFCCYQNANDHTNVRASTTNKARL